MTACRNSHCCRWQLQPQVRTEHLLVLVLLQPVEVFLLEESPEQSVGLTLDRDPSVGTDGG